MVIVFKINDIIHLFVITFDRCFDCIVGEISEISDSVLVRLLWFDVWSRWKPDVKRHSTCRVRGELHILDCTRETGFYGRLLIKGVIDAESWLKSHVSVKDLSASIISGISYCIIRVSLGKGINGCSSNVLENSVAQTIFDGQFFSDFLFIR